MTATEVRQEGEVRERRTWRAEAERVGRVASAGAVGGLVAGFAVGGVGGRVAMRVVALQSHRWDQGITTDSGATTGEMTLLGTLSLVVFLTIIGAFGGVVFAGARSVLPARGRAAAWAAITGVVVGSMIISSEGVDYQVLGRRWVSVAMFAALAAGYGLLSARVAERLLRPEGWARTTTRVRAGLPFVALGPGLTVVPVGIALAALAAIRTSGRVSRWGRSPAVLAVARLGLALVVGASAVDVARTIGELA